MRRAALGLSAAALISISDPLAAQVPAGPEFRVNERTDGDQLFPRVAMGDHGDFVVTWYSTAEGLSRTDIAGQRFNAAGTPMGSEFLVNTYTTDYQQLPDVAVGPAGNFLIAWGSNRQDGSGSGVFGQRFDALGDRFGEEFRINSSTTGSQQRPSVAFSPSGGSVVVWTTPAAGQRFDPSGLNQGGEFLVDPLDTGPHARSAAAFMSDGDLVVAWDSGVQSGDVFARRFHGGVPKGPTFRLNAVIGGLQLEPAIASLPGGGFVAAWSGSGGSTGVFVRLFTRTGAALGPEFLVGAGGEGDPVSVAADGSGDFLVTWTEHRTFVDDLFGARFDAHGARRGPEFRVTVSHSYDINRPRAAMSKGGDFVVVWQSFIQAGSVRDVYARRFGGLSPVSLSVDAGGNSVWEPGELAEVKPAWRNHDGAARSLGGRMADIVGPAGSAFTIEHDVAAYGTVDDGATAACSECYVVSVLEPPARPVLHRDATVVETITPEEEGQEKRWVLHVGESFSDVARANPFYRFIETMLHNGVTGGCDAVRYCPEMAASRAQMAVFVLAAKEGPAYAPPACGDPVFGDVPAADPFCPYIEELARRGVVSGCGGGDFCPEDAVTREQMAVFMLRTLDPTLDPLACGTPVFADVPASSPFCRWIEELARRNVVTGCGGGNYCPTASVTREQMSVFIGTTFGLTLYGP
jgi:S-layer family protein